jgi:hypothetical protein
MMFECTVPGVFQFLHLMLTLNTMKAKWLN